MSRILLMACRGGSLKKGGSPSTISITIMPETSRIRQRFTLMGSRYLLLGPAMPHESKAGGLAPIIIGPADALFVLT